MQADRLLALRQSAHHVANRNLLMLGRALSLRVFARLNGTRSTIPSRRYLSAPKPSAKLNRLVSNHLHDVKRFTSANPVTIWRSTSNNPYENLAIENYLLKNSDPDSRILFTYINWPCVVIGRNQNPWLECNLERIQKGLPYHKLGDKEEEDYRARFPHRDTSRDTDQFPLDLVRRRSGGGTVIHDAGNLNFSFIVPNDKDFTRDTHAHLVVSMLEKLRLDWPVKALYSSVRVNDRHDIVMKLRSSVKNNTQKEFKISGSAFKLTRGRALHHGTILHSSPNILEHNDAASVGRGVFSEVLSSPAKPYLEAKGVGSVRSPVHNLFRVKDQRDRIYYGEELRHALHDEFKASHKIARIEIQQVGSQDCAEDANEQIFRDVRELMTDEWRFCQTPSFEYSSVMNGLKVDFQVKHGIVGRPSIQDTEATGITQSDRLSRIEGKKLHEIRDWADYFPTSNDLSSAIVSHLATVFPRIIRAESSSCTAAEHTTTKNVESRHDRQEDVVVVERQSPNGSVETEKEGENLIVER